MKFISRTVTGLVCAISWGLALPVLAAEKVNIGIVTAPNFVHTIAATKFKEELDKALPGKYDVVIHHSAALGSETQVLQQMQLGTVQMTVCTTGPVEAFVPEIKAQKNPTAEWLMDSCGKGRGRGGFQSGEALVGEGHAELELEIGEDTQTADDHMHADLVCIFDGEPAVTGHFDLGVTAERLPDQLHALLRRKHQ